ncbi:MAG: hypothetical protein M3N17_09150 [Actinomycetota bacterium]|nr:hypothetical protein [Actinomycetota bacterium]
MRSTALVTGSPLRISSVSAALEADGFDVTAVSEHERLADACAALGPGSLDCYMQLPGEISPDGETVVERFHNFLRLGLLHRFDAAGRVLPLLREGGMVVLVAGNHPPGASTPDDQAARVSLLRVLAHAVLAERAEAGVRATVVEHGRTPAELAELARHRGADRLRIIAEYVETAPEMSYADWRLQVLQMASMEG